MVGEALYWCMKCNVPLLSKGCDLCEDGVAIKEVKITPPGNVKPMFAEERRRLWETISNQYGRDVAPFIAPEDGVSLLNKVPHVDLAYEVIVDGQVLGLWEYDVRRGAFRFVPYMEGARRMAKQRARKWILVDRGAERAIAMQGRNLLAPGVKDYDRDVREEDFVYVVNEEWRAIGVGKVVQGFGQRLSERKGMVVKIRHHGEPKEAEILTKKATWSDVVEANRSFIEIKEREAIKFIQRACAEREGPVLVSFSGGKDSLATLLLVKKALGEDFYVLFTDTGIEYPETISYVERVLARLGLKDKTIRASSFTSFFDAIDIFGPPARDFRWCCKTCKLAPIAYAVKGLGGRCLTFIGLREIESAKRRKQGAVWEGIWVKGQVGISPIHDWGTLNVWLYLFKEGVELNPLYYKGLERIGCWVCPSMDLAEMRIIEEVMGPLWQGYLRKVTDALSLDEEGVKLGLWRWRFKFPRWLNVERRRACRDPLQCLWEKKEVPIKREDDFERVLGVLKTMYEVLEEDKRMATLMSRGRKIASLVKRDTKIVVEAEDMDWVKILRGIARALLCVKCMLCLATCPNEAVKMGLSGVEILTEKCMACGECNYTCPIWAYSLKSPHIAKRLLD
jgi:phosphoadenosine phosphosulfate reductase